jgi:hypothetical protein
MARRVRASGKAQKSIVAKRNPEIVHGIQAADSSQPSPLQVRGVDAMILHQNHKGTL